MQNKENATSTAKRVAFVTGAGGYIGTAIARELAAQGYAVAVSDFRAEAAEATVAQIIEAGGEAIAVPCDVTDPASVDAAIARTVAHWGSLWAAVHAAGGSAKLAGDRAKYADLIDQDDFVFDRVMQVNLYGAFYVSRAAGRVLAAAGQGRIVHISSAIGLEGLEGKAEYAAAKGGVIALVKSQAKEMGKWGVTVNSVAPGAVGNVWVKDEELYHVGYIAHRRGNAEDIARAVAFLCSEGAGYITGHTLPVDGGRHLGMKGD